MFVEIRERLSLDVICGINKIIISNSFEHPQSTDTTPTPASAMDSPTLSMQETLPPEVHSKPNDAIEVRAEEACIEEDATTLLPASEGNLLVLKNAGKLLVDTTVAPQNITYPTDLKLLNDAREKSEEIIDKLYRKDIHGVTKVRTYRDMMRGNRF